MFDRHEAGRFRRPFLAAFLIEFGASFTTLKTRVDSFTTWYVQSTGMYVLETELFNTADCIILRAIVSSMVRLPTLEKLRWRVRELNIGRQLPPVNAIDVPPVRCEACIKRCHWYQNITSSPRSLRHHCRILIRNCLGPSRLLSVSSLPLPTTLIDYLLPMYSASNARTFLHSYLSV